MKPTPEQQAIIDASGKIIKGIAFAGAGKTSTFIARAEAHPERSLYLCFNKSVQQEAERKFPANVTCMTQHSMAHRAIVAKRGYNGIKYTNIGKLFLKPIATKFRIDYYMTGLVQKTVENFCNSADDALTSIHAQPDVIGRYNRDVTSEVTAYAKQVWDVMISGKDPANFPMTHGGYLKLFQLTSPNLGYPVVMLDEAQDTNPVVQDIVLKQAEFGSQVILTGDPYQQIYAWRGAVDALGKIEGDTYYLTQSFRFGSGVADCANAILNEFFGEERKIVGLGKQSGIYSETRNVPFKKYTYLSRTNAFLFGEASRLATAGGVRVYAPGGGQNGELPLFQAITDVFALYQGRKFDIRNDFDLRSFDCYKSFTDFVATGMADAEWTISAAMIQKYGEGIPEQISKIRKSLVSDESQADVTLVTAHRSKGLEWDNVVLGIDYAEMFGEDGEVLPIGDNRKTQISADEVNLLYVAATRAKQNLVLNGGLTMLLAHRGDKIEVKDAAQVPPQAAAPAVTEVADDSSETDHVSDSVADEEAASMSGVEVSDF